MKKRPAMHPLSFLAFSMGWGTFWLHPALRVGNEHRRARRRSISQRAHASLYVAIFPSIVAYICYNRGSN